VTQRNAALVEENAATARTLEQQARAMDERVSYFRLADDPVADVAPAPKALLVKTAGQIKGRPALVTNTRTRNGHAVDSGTLHRAS
jgi:hypothetical protein